MSRQIKVHLGKDNFLVGTLFFNEAANRETCAFEYDSEWIESKNTFPIDPALAVQAGRYFKSKKQTGSVFFGAISDSEPDGWARQVILRAHAKEKKDSRLLNSLDFLLAVDDFSRVGALRFKDESGIFQRSQTKMAAPPLVELGHLFNATRAVETDTATAKDLQYLRGKGTSLGGLRPKCTVVDDDGSLSIGKFPSVSDTYSVTKAEVLALHIAKEAGINAAKARILDSEGTAVTLIKRFDRDSEGYRIPYVSAATLLGIEDSHDIHTYTEIVDALKRYSADYRADAEELWQRIALTILITNVDDHMRNHGFLHVDKGLWRLSPAFDINPFPDKQRILKTWISEDTGDEASIHALMHACPYFGINKRRAKELLLSVEIAVASWRKFGKKIGLSNAELKILEPAFEHEERIKAKKVLALLQ